MVDYLALYHLSHYDHRSQVNFHHNTLSKCEFKALFLAFLCAHSGRQQLWKVWMLQIPITLPKNAGVMHKCQYTSTNSLSFYRSCYKTYQKVKVIFWLKNAESWHHWCYKEKWMASITALRVFIKNQVLFFQEQPFIEWWVLLVFQGLWSKASYQSNLFNIWRSAYLTGQVAINDYNCRNSTFEQRFYQITHIWKKAKKNSDWREGKSYLKNGMRRCAIIQKLCDFMCTSAWWPKLPSE